MFFSVFRLIFVYPLFFHLGIFRLGIFRSMFFVCCIPSDAKIRRIDLPWLNPRPDRAPDSELGFGYSRLRTRTITDRLGPGTQLWLITDRLGSRFVMAQILGLGRLGLSSSRIGSVLQAHLNLDSARGSA